MKTILTDDARNTLDQRQKTALFLLLAAAGFLLFWRRPLVLWLFNLLASFFYLTSSFYKFLLVFLGLYRRSEIFVPVEAIDRLGPDELPVYTILLPLYRETEVLDQLISSISRLDYPAERLDVKLLIEANDAPMQAALAARSLPANFELVIIPDSLPKTKPKACNVGLEQARGEFLVIYDAEDIPDSDQLKKSVWAYRNLQDPRVICLQAKLNYYNSRQNLLTRWFTAEYSMWFDLYLPGMDFLQVPIPLGGTSNHFRTGKLKELGGWDPYNVAEDCELGIRLFRAGYRTRVLDSTTWEEANSNLGNWLAQRSRWVKGYLQTFLVHHRKPVRLVRELGWFNYFSFSLSVGGLFVVLLLNPLYWVTTSLWLLRYWGRPELLFPNPYYELVTRALLAGNFIFILLNLLGCVRRRLYYLVPVTFIAPVYWFLMSLGAWQGFRQLIFSPHYWAKSRHGLTVPLLEAGEAGVE
ncbi:MAG TPA: glycosyltransferase family 2 protein [bacterium]|nr:glycosyltransferase family 2 protein [bacterium]HNS48887.1 glycosyltransferase family 2 protein [bacterium]